ncbi:MAG TPA: rhodanese-like domain-containing protein [Nocardioidaceae bacterium]|jgi:phage shock protein E|nr:rhodanese-like domain-containing protein [Nocardioidaceae bacterium]
MRKSLTTTLGGAAAALLMLTSACSSGSDAVEKVDAAEAVEIIEAGEHTVIDVRTPAEFAAGHVDGSENIDVSAGSFEQQVEQLDKDEEYVVYCQSGNRSAQAADTMAELGFTEIVDGGGIVDLQSAGADIVAGG